MFLPMTKFEMDRLGWNQADVILVSGDAYIDSPYDGIAIIGKYLQKSGFRVAVISQPDIKNPDEITALGEPALFWGVSSGAVDSMVANYTSLMKPRRNDDLTPGGINNRRPDRAVIKYVNCIRANFKNTVSVVIGGIEASLRRIAHYDYWSDKVRRSILFDSKADYLVYGMGERTILEIANAFKKEQDIRNIRGICYKSSDFPRDYISLDSYEEVAADKRKFSDSFMEFYKNTDPLNAFGLVQKHGDRYLVQNPPNYYLEQAELDSVYEMDFEYDAHPVLKKKGKIKALDTTRFSINSHRGCFGECNFCAITMHQGRRIRSRSVKSIIREVKNYTGRKDFKGNINDVGGPTANMFGMSCKKMDKKGACKDKKCLSPGKCKALANTHQLNISLLRELRKINGVKKIFISSGIRYDLISADKENGRKYLEEILEYHIPGQMKIAPEHTSPEILRIMGKPDQRSLSIFKAMFEEIKRKKKLKKFLTYYLIAAHPGCNNVNMKDMAKYVRNELKISPEQIQVFTPTPSTISTLIYYTGINPFTGDEVFVEKKLSEKRKQKEIITGNPGNKMNKFRGKNNKNRPGRRIMKK